jgi:hypothetical protein
MKKLISIFILAIFVAGCSEDMLDRYPLTSLVTENFFKTSDDATRALVSIYNMNLLENFWGSFLISEAASDISAGGCGSGDDKIYQTWDRGLIWPNANANQYPWKVCYGGIFRANTYLENEMRIDWKGKETMQKQYQAEARFLRAYFHFYLTRLFGEIPAVLHTLAPDETPGRTPAEELFTLILNDLKFCADNGLNAKYGEMDPGNWGHATKWAAEAMIARIYLYYSGYYGDATLGDFTAKDAQACIDDVIDNSGHALVPEFASLWRVATVSVLGGDTSINQYAGEVNPEVIWSIRYEPVGNPYETWHRMIGPRINNIDPYGRGYGALPVLPVFWNAFDTADKRRNATIISWIDEGKIYNYKTYQQAQYTGYSVKKYLYRSVGGKLEVSNLDRDGFEDYIVIRFADALLMGAELHLINGENGTALSLINKVRERAFGDASHNYKSLTTADIFTERKFELATEGLRYWDILRSCKGDFSGLAQMLTYVDETDGGDFSRTLDVNSLDVDGNRFVETKGLFQIPQSEIDLMEGAIDQNPGYTGE